MCNILLKGLFWLGMVLVFLAVLVVEGGGGNIFNGVDGFMVGVLLLLGIYGLVFLNYYSGDCFNDGNGNFFVFGFSVKVNVVVFKIVYMININVYGGLLGFYGVLLLVDQMVQVVGCIDSCIGLGDLEVGLLVVWYQGDWYWYGLMVLVVLIGLYNKDWLVNIGLNYIIIWLQFGWIYVLVNGIDIFSCFIYSFNICNNVINYKFGQYFEVDYNFGYVFIFSLKVGLQGYYFQQIINDEQNGVKVGSDGNKGWVLVIGFGLFYQVSFVFFEFKYFIEIRVENWVQGKSLWFKSVFKF